MRHVLETEGKPAMQLRTTIPYLLLRTAIHGARSAVSRGALVAIAGCAIFIAAPAKADVISVRIADGNDDAEEHLNENNNIDLGSSDLEIGAEGGGSDAQLIGVRFLDIDIPRGAIINSANIQFTVDETDDEVQEEPIRIFGELGEALRFSGNGGDISSRTRTGLSIDWADIPPWDTVGDAGPDQQTPDIGILVQAIVNQSTWEPNNAMVLMMLGHENFERTAESFNGTPEAAALLTIDFDPNSFFAFGDYNDDGAVDLADYEILKANFNTGTTFAEGDGTLDGKVDLRDFVEFLREFNAGGGNAAAVPEPSTVLLLGAGIALLMASTKRRAI